MDCAGYVGWCTVYWLLGDLIMKIKLGLFKTAHNSISAIAVEKNGKSWADEDGDYVRLTESKDVEFKELDRRQVVDAELVKIDAQEKKIRAAFFAAINELEDRRSSLLSLPAPVQS